MALRAALAEAFATFAASRHDEVMCVWSDVLELGRGPRLGTGLTAHPHSLGPFNSPTYPKSVQTPRNAACGPARTRGPRRGRVSGAAPDS